MNLMHNKISVGGTMVKMLYLKISSNCVSSKLQMKVIDPGFGGITSLISILGV